MAKASKTPDSFTPRAWKVLAGARDRDGYVVNGGETGAAAMLVEHGLVTLNQISPTRRVAKATEKGHAAHDAYLQEQGHAPISGG